MHVTRHTDYALRALMYVALKQGQIATISEIAASYDISRHHLTKVVNRLHQCGHLLATRGKNGGLVLARPAGEINVGAVFRDMENELAVVPCMGDPDACVLEPSCELKQAFGKATGAFLAVLDDYSLQDLLPKRRAPALRDLLAIHS